MKTQTKKVYKRLILVLFAVMLAACDFLENKVNHTAVSVDTNAFYSVYQKKPSDSWRVLTENNIKGLETITFTVADKNTAFGVIFVCPSKQGDRAHEVHVYYATKAEMERLNFFCLISIDEIIMKPMYGGVNGVTMADINNASGDVVRLAFSKDQSLDVWEAYATLVRSGTRDIVGIRGKSIGEGIISPERFLIRRQFPLAANTEASNLDVDFSGRDSSYYTAAFDPNTASTVNIIGAKNEDSISAKIGFLSRSQTLLKLDESSSDSFTFLPVPLQEFTEIVDEFYNPFEFNPGEGHELVVTAKAADGLVSREVTKLFTLSDNVTHNVQLPEPVQNFPQLALNKNGDVQNLVIKWNAHNDAASGQTRVYRWIVQGQAADYITDKVPENIVDDVKWHITVTPGWLNAIGARNEYTLVIPTHFENGLSNVENIKVKNSWRKEWSFKVSSEVQWEMSAIAVADENKADAVIEYLLNRNFENDIQFSQVYTRSSTQP